MKGYLGNNNKAPSGNRWPQLPRLKYSYNKCKIKRYPWWKNCPTFSPFYHLYLWLGYCLNVFHPFCFVCFTSSESFSAFYTKNSEQLTYIFDAWRQRKSSAISSFDLLHSRSFIDQVYCNSEFPFVLIFLCMKNLLWLIRKKPFSVWVKQSLLPGNVVNNNIIPKPLLTIRIPPKNSYCE